MFTTTYIFKCRFNFYICEHSFCRFLKQRSMAIKITNKDVIQSYLMTVSKYDFSVYENTFCTGLWKQCSVR